MPLELQQIKAEKEALEAEKKEALEKEAAVLAARQQRQAEHQEPRCDKLPLKISFNELLF